VAMSGILPRNPRLRLVSVESGIGWLPFVKESLDHGFTYSNVAGEKPEFTKLPSEYLREQVWACTFFEEFPAHHYLPREGFLQYALEDWPVRILAVMSVLAPAVVDRGMRRVLQR